MTATSASGATREAIRILLVEDTLIDAELTLRHLKRCGLVFESRRVATEADFRTALSDFAPDVILSDYAMPLFDGLRALELARKLAAGIPFIFVSGSIRPQDVNTGRGEGAMDFVNKDDLSRLGPAIENALACTPTTRK